MNVEVVVAHSERATLRFGDVFLKVDAVYATIDQPNSSIERYLSSQQPTAALDAARVDRWWESRELAGAM